MMTPWGSSSLPVFASIKRYDGRANTLMGRQAIHRSGTRNCNRWGVGIWREVARRKEKHPWIRCNYFFRCASSFVKSIGVFNGSHGLPVVHPIVIPGRGSNEGAPSHKLPEDQDQKMQQIVLISWPASSHHSNHKPSSLLAFYVLGRDAQSWSFPEGDN